MCIIYLNERPRSFNSPMAVVSVVCFVSRQRCLYVWLFLCVVFFKMFVELSHTEAFAHAAE